MVKVFIEKDELYPVYDAYVLPNTDSRPFEFEIDDWRMEWITKGWEQWNEVQDYLKELAESK